MFCVGLVCCPCLCYLLSGCSQYYLIGRAAFVREVTLACVIGLNHMSVRSQSNRDAFQANSARASNYRGTKLDLEATIRDF
ncbi:hypothetical protein HG15A2_18220 [Adhaeretor mobilis]|uniref:Uncharacterized protein n=1 Tax=Adhaeretor mobilis TaxID=1930276 RepID=A0A517MUH9_9BACT|nr:hypothetical protein HG15A2_18220 [Adhaeretor mobilis]